MMSFSSPFPPSVAFSILAASPGAEVELMARLHPQERALLRESASTKRHLEFSLGRLAAKEALLSLGIPVAEPVLIGEKGMPLWPDGIVGSITHAAGSAVAVAALARDVWALGIDLQDLGQRRRVDIARMICHSAELPWIDEVSEQRQNRLLCLFSAKESIYKALFPICRRYISYKDVQLSWQKDSSSFNANLETTLSSRLYCGFSFPVGISIKNSFVLSHVCLEPA